MKPLLQQVFDAGVVGAGGAGFPAHVKYAKPAEILLINGAECEPLLKTDQYIMAHFAGPLCRAAGALGEHLSAKRIIFVLKRHYEEQIRTLKTAMAASPRAIPMELCPVDSIYPVGDEQTLLYEAAGLQVPPGGIPLAAGAVVVNAGTLLSVADALEDRPVTHKYLTITGEVARPAVIRVPIGISFEECISLAGLRGKADCFVIAGGPIMGRVIEGEAIPGEVVTKTTSGIVLLPEDHYLQQRTHIAPTHTKNRARTSCIQCSICSDLCPRSLLGSPLRPHLIMRAMGSSADMDALLEKEAARNAMLCCECGICEIYACPMELQPCRLNILIKQEMRSRGMHYSPPPGGEVNPLRSSRRIPSKRMAARAGVLDYYDRNVEDFHEVQTCARVAIPLNMHAGAAAAPCVQTGQRVTMGQLIADIPANTLGARIHASIGGVVRSLDGRIVIEAEEAQP